MIGDGPKGPVPPPGPPDRDDWRIIFRPDIPSSARIHDYFLGGKDNYPGDRDAGDQIIALLPNIREATQINRASFAAVRYRANRPHAVTALGRRTTTVRSVVAVVLSRPYMVGRESIKWGHAL